MAEAAMTEEEEIAYWKKQLAQIHTKSVSSRAAHKSEEVIRQLNVQDQHVKGSQNSFLKSTGEKANINQYWYTATTIAAIVKEVEAVGKRIACISTPSVYFSLSPHLRKQSMVFDIDKAFSKDRGFVFYDFNSPLAIPEALHHTFDYAVIDPPFITREVWSKYALTARLLLRNDADTTTDTTTGSTIDTSTTDTTTDTSTTDTTIDTNTTTVASKTQKSESATSAVTDSAPATSLTPTTSSAPATSPATSLTPTTSSAPPTSPAVSPIASAASEACVDAAADGPAGKLLCSTIVENKDMMFELLGVTPVAFQPSIPNLVYQYNFYTNYRSRHLNHTNAEINT